MEVLCRRERVEFISNLIWSLYFSHILSKVSTSLTWKKKNGSHHNRVQFIICVCIYIFSQTTKYFHIVFFLYVIMFQILISFPKVEYLENWIVIA